MSTNVKANEVLMNGYGSVRNVRDAKVIAEASKATHSEGISKIVDACVVLNEALKEAEFIILQFTEKARQYDIVMAELQKKAGKRKK